MGIYNGVFAQPQNVTLPPLSLRFYVSAKDGVDTGLIAPPLRFQPLYNIVIESDCDPILGSRSDDLGVLHPVWINAEFRHIRNCLPLHLFIGHSIEACQIGLTLRWSVGAIWVFN